MKKTSCYIISLLISVLTVYVGIFDRASIHDVRNTGINPLNLNIQEEPRSYVVHRTDESIHVDGRMSEMIWGHVEWTDDFVDIRGGNRPEPEFRTRVKMLWDDDFLYVYAELEEPHLWGTMTERESPLWLDNALELFIDPDGDGQNYIEFQVNALGTIWDLLLTRPYSQSGFGISQWNLLDHESAVYLDGDINNPEGEDTKWSAEIAIPVYAVLEVAPGFRRLAGNQWRVNFLRAQRRLDVEDGEYRLRIDPETNRPHDPDFYTWSPQGHTDIHDPAMWGYVEFSDEIAGP